MVSVLVMFRWSAEAWRLPVVGTGVLGGGLKQGSCEIVKRIVVAEAVEGGHAVPDADDAQIGRRVDSTCFLTRIKAERRNGAILARESFPAGTISAHAHPLPAAVVRTPWLIAFWPTQVRTAITVAAFGTNKTNIATAPPIQAQAIPRAIVLATVHLHVEGDPLTCCTAKAVIANALARIVGRGEGAQAMPTAIVQALRILAIRARPTLLTHACPIDTLTMDSAIGDANLVLAYIRRFERALGQAPAVGTRAPSAAAHAVAIAILVYFKKPTAVLHLANKAGEPWEAIAFSQLCIAGAMSRAKPGRSADLHIGIHGCNAIHCLTGRLFVTARTSAKAESPAVQQHVHVH